MAWMNSAPEYAKPYIGKSMFVRIHDEDSCYLYKKTSRRIPGRTYPVPVETYIGKITRSNGLIPCTHRLIDTSAIHVSEYGWSQTLLQIATDSWKRAVGNDWEEVLSAIIVDTSALSYLQSSITMPIPVEILAKVKTQRNSLFRRLKDERKIEKDDLEPLKTIFMLDYGNNCRMLSEINETQRAILDKLQVQIQLEVC